MKYLKIALVMFFLMLAGCGEPAECKLNSDCSQKDCATVSCVEGACKYNTKNDCCGNGKCEAAETSCSCPKDCSKDKCEGAAVVEKTSKGVPVYAKYLQRTCRVNECITAFNKTTQQEIPMLFEKELSYFQTSNTVTWKKPFDVKTDKVVLEIKLREKTDDLILPIKFYEFQLLSGSTVYGKLEKQTELTKLDDKIVIEIPISIVPEKIELEKTMKLKIFYEYTYIYDRKTGQTKTDRKDFEKDFSEKLVLVDIR